MNREFPGTSPVKGREYLFLESSSATAFSTLFSKITTFGESPLPSSGGAINEEAVIILPIGKRLQCLSFKGDLSGWRRKILECANVNQLLWGELVGLSMKVSDGKEYPLKDCELSF